MHDLRNPLAAIYGGAEMMVDTELSQPQIKRVAGNIYRASRRIQQMLQDLLDLSKGRAGRREVGSIREVVDAAVEANSAESERHGVRVEVSLPEDLEAAVERARMERVFSNLIGNALEAMPHGGAIRIVGHRENGAMLVEVSDTGPGIPAEIGDQLFQPFATAGKKSGLGLALSRQTVLEHGGDIWAGAAEGGGAKFSVKLPAGEGSPLPDGRGSETEPRA